MQGKTKKLFTEKQASVCAALAGPIPPGILIFLNYRALGKEKESYLTIAGTLIITVLLFYGLMAIPEDISDRIPNAAFTLFYGLLVYLFYRRFLTDEIKQELENGAQKGSNWVVAGVSVLGLVLSLGILFALAADQPFYDGEVMRHKGNELYYDTNDDISKAQVDFLVNQLETQGFFGQDFGNISRLQYLDGEYHVTLVVDKSLWDDPDFMAFATSLGWLVQVEFGKTTMVKLESVSLSGKSTFKMIAQ